MLSDAQTREMLRAMDEMFDHMDPPRWRALVTKVITSGLDWRETFGSGEVPDAERMDGFWEQYLAWKRMLAKGALKSGRALERAFWKDLLDPDKRAALALSADDPLALIDEELLADIALSLQHNEAFANSCATTLMHEAIRATKEVPETEAEKLNDSGFDHHHQGGYPDALGLHEQAIAASPEFPLAWINKGIALKNLERFDEAIECYDHVIEEIDADYKKAWYNKGVALVQSGRPEEAIPCFDRALQIDADYEMAARRRDECERMVKPGDVDLERASGYVEQFAQNPQALQLLQMGQELQAAGNCDAAARVFEQADAALPDNPFILNEWGNTLYESGRIDEAEAKFARAIEIAPCLGTIWIDICRCRLAREDFAAALEASEAAVENVPQNSMSWANRAAALLGLGRAEEALESAERAAQLDPRNGWAWLHVGHSQWCMGNLPEAEAAFEKLLSVRPDFEHADEVRRMLRDIRPSSTLVPRGEARSELQELPSATAPARDWLFTAIYPNEVPPEQVSCLVAYAHVESATREVVEDATKRIPAVDGADLAGGSAPPTRRVTDKSTIAVTPDLPGVRFDPARGEVSLWQDLQSVEFRFRPGPDAAGRVLRGWVHFWLECILLASVDVVVRVRADDVPETLRQALRQVNSRPYRKVFPSYSHDDAQVVQRLETYAEAFGDIYLRDVRVLRAGQVWSAEIERLIRGADVFQLFWSDNARQSRYVRQEWESALHERATRPDPHFLRPVYWSSTPAAPVPEALSELHFARIPLLRGGD